MKIDESAGSVKDHGQGDAEDDVVSQYLVGPNAFDVEIMANREIEHSQQESFLPDQSSVAKRWNNLSDDFTNVLFKNYLRKKAQGLLK